MPTGQTFSATQPGTHKARGSCLLYARAPKAIYFDFYERTHLNHILAQQNPRTGMFCYMTPLMSGEARAYSSPFDDFWCCVGTGMESHAKQGESIYWHQGRDTLIVNLFIPSILTWAEDGSRFELATAYPLSGRVELVVAARTSGTMLTIALRKPGWALSAALRVNGRAVAAETGADGYIRVRRAWKTGDRLTLDLPMELRAEATTDDPHMVALFRGPMVLAADLGPAQAGTPYDGPVPALVADTPLQAVEQTAVPAVYRTPAGGYTLSPFAAQHERRTAVYFPAYTAAQWSLRQTADEAKMVAARALAARTVDQVRLGEMQSERDHDVKADIPYPVIYRGRNGRCPLWISGLPTPDSERSLRQATYPQPPNTLKRPPEELNQAAEGSRLGAKRGAQSRAI
jgi:DUF1680 family protein